MGRMGQQLLKRFLLEALASSKNEKLAKFEAEGVRSDLRAELAADLNAYPLAREGQAAVRFHSTGATDELDDVIHQGLAIIDGLDVYLTNFYAKEKTKLDTWKTASRLEREAVKTAPMPAK